MVIMPSMKPESDPKRPASTNDESPLAADEQRITEVEEILAAYDDTPMDAMTPQFYEHAYGELSMAVRDLLGYLRSDTGNI